MEDYLVNFKDMEWQCPANGIRYKVFVNGNQRIRLVEFSEGFVEEEWCTKGHAGYVLEGSLTTNFNGSLITHKKGDICFIPEGEENKHKAVVGKGERALMLLFEIIK